MAKGKNFDMPKKDGTVWKLHRFNGIRLFLYETKTWDKKALTQIIKTTEGKSKLDNKMYVLQRDKTSEQLMLWLKNYDDKIKKNSSLSPAEKQAFLKCNVDKGAQTIVSEVEQNFELFTESYRTHQHDQ